MPGTFISEILWHVQSESLPGLQELGEAMFREDPGAGTDAPPQSAECAGRSVVPAKPDNAFVRQERGAS